jgi:hypothetical protein
MNKIMSETVIFQNYHCPDTPCRQDVLKKRKKKRKPPPNSQEEKRRAEYKSERFVAGS